VGEGVQVSLQPIDGLHDWNLRLVLEDTSEEVRPVAHQRWLARPRHSNDHKRLRVRLHVGEGLAWRELPSEAIPWREILGDGADRLMAARDPKHQIGEQLGEGGEGERRQPPRVVKLGLEVGVEVADLGVGERSVFSREGGKQVPDGVGLEDRPQREAVLIRTGKVTGKVS